MAIIIENKIDGTAVPLVFLNPDLLESYLAEAPAATRAFVAANHFGARPQTSCLIPGAQGIAIVLAGIKGVDDPHGFAYLPFVLPEGRYRLATEGLVCSPSQVALGWGLGSYQFVRYKSPKRQPASLCLPAAPDMDQAIEILHAVNLVRDLVNTPTEDMGPQHLAKMAQGLAREYGGSFREWVGDDLLKHNFPAIHAVGRASHRPPRLIELTWGNDAHPKIALVGKGVCFDTGGLDIKGHDGMRWMKKDMGGGAHVLGLARLIMATRLPVRLQMLIPAVENAISGNAYRPGDVVATRRGINIEIGNTDAEGRVILADALAFAAEVRPEIIIDFATLTAAARTALGPELPAMFTNRDEWAAALITQSQLQHDPLWRMPLWQNYNAMIDSTIADLNNTGGQPAGCITAALFLEHFIPAAQPWIHIDLFAWNPKAKPGHPEGGEAQTLRTVFALLQEKFG